MNQDRIKDRILRRAARMWGYNELEAEASFDPIVSLLLSACAAELEKLDFELENSRSRIIERVLEVMFPEEVSGVLPSRTLLQVSPLENNTRISLYNHFKTIIKQHSIYNPTETITKDLFFSPSIEAGLTTGSVKYIAYGNTLTNLESFFFDAAIGKAEKHLPSGELWVGIHSPNKEDLEDLMFFIDISNTYQKEIFFYYLKQVKVYFGEKEYLLKEGYNVDQENISLQNIITKNYSDLEHIYNDVNQYYFSNFFTLKGKFGFNDKTQNEVLFTSHFPGHTIGENDDIIWLKFKFSEAIVPDILQNVRIALNCIPAINIRNTKIVRRIKGRLNIIPIPGEDDFLDLDYISDDHGKRLDIKNYETETEGMTALLRKGGVSRFDQRSASELLQYLLALIKDETAAFAGIGADTAKDTLRHINQNVASLHQTAKEKSYTQTSNPYLIVSSAVPDADVRCTISYWSTAAEHGNNLKPGTVFTLEGGNGLLDNNAVMLYASYGGRKKLSSQDKILEYRNALLTRGRIVTIADIRAFGMNHFKNLITGIEVQKGTKKEVSLKGGFSRTIDIFLVKNKEQTENINPSEWEYVCESFLLKLKNASANIYPYRLFEK
ncbi:hypothetical protein ACM39_11615 [Chryseobacterium sp. FH2]|uniref:type VI secretion system baseplate subunit TssF n=1 Tax=Chryseobacterium sp. FH2 TaxID=1674291 RepID=UPI00065AAAB5|nr:type VI secretion system baseplate subunit TssF [Chryseobacterium sp. FH2]KMQ67972.1 hypothetical protein ACM39_11615 [Chryseobacterium sp. FH2]